MYKVKFAMQMAKETNPPTLNASGPHLYLGASHFVSKRAACNFKLNFYVKATGN